MLQEGTMQKETICKNANTTNEPKRMQSEYDKYDGVDRVLKPWTPIEYGEKSVSVWGRRIVWGDDSILPAQIWSQESDLLSSPMRLIVGIDGLRHSVTLGRFKHTESKKSKGLMVAEGMVDGIKVTADMFVEFDGFLWITLSFEDSQKNRRIDSLHVVAPMKSTCATLYQTFSRGGYGWLEGEPKKISWYSDAAGHDDPDEREHGKEVITDFYHWCGTEDFGLGFTYSTVEHWYPETLDNFVTIYPGEDVVEYTINLVEKATVVDGRKYHFGVQPTPIKPLPPDYHSMVGATLLREEWTVWQHMPDNIDMLLVWPTYDQIMRGLNDPHNLDYDRMKAAVDYAHERGVAIMQVALCPQKVSLYSEEFKEYAEEWKCKPESILIWKELDGTEMPHYQNCAGSESLRKWEFTGYTENVRKFNLDGIYFDGWLGGQMACHNEKHGCGWIDDDGNRRVTVPVLEGREFFKRLAMWLEDNVDSPYVSPKSAPEREGFPRYRLWIHSWEFVASVMGFATDWLTGEFTMAPPKGIRTTLPEGTYGKIGMDLFRARGLSTNWGVPNLFYPILASESGEDNETDKQTLMAFAWFLPHGVPFGQLRDLNVKTTKEIFDILREFGTRKADFVPGWRNNPYLTVVEPDIREVMVGTWSIDSENKVLAVVSNLHVDDTYSIVLDWHGFENPRIINARAQEEVLLKDRKIVVDLGPESFVLLWIEQTT